MDARFPKIAEQLLLIERELRIQGWWDEVSPSAEALSSVEPFSVAKQMVKFSGLVLPQLVTSTR